MYFANRSFDRNDHAIPLFIDVNFLPISFRYFKSVCYRKRDIHLTNTATSKDKDDYLDATMITREIRLRNTKT